VPSQPARCDIKAAHFAPAQKKTTSCLMTLVALNYSSAEISRSFPDCLRFNVYYS
jgi:hypothetical protein